VWIADHSAVFHAAHAAAIAAAGTTKSAARITLPRLARWRNCSPPLAHRPPWGPTALSTVCAQVNVIPTEIMAIPSTPSSR